MMNVHQVRLAPVRQDALDILARLGRAGNGVRPRRSRGPLAHYRRTDRASA